MGLSPPSFVPCLFFWKHQWIRHYNNVVDSFSIANIWEWNYDFLDSSDDKYTCVSCMYINFWPWTVLRLGSDRGWKSKCNWMLSVCGYFFLFSIMYYVDEFILFFTCVILTHLRAEVTSWWNQIPTTDIISLGPFVCPGAYTVATTVPYNDGASTLTGCCPT